MRKIKLLLIKKKDGTFRDKIFREMKENPHIFFILIWNFTGFEFLKPPLNKKNNCRHLSLKENSSKFSRQNKLINHLK